MMHTRNLWLYLSSTTLITLDCQPPMQRIHTHLATQLPCPNGFGKGAVKAANALVRLCFCRRFVVEMLIICRDAVRGKNDVM